MALPNFRGRSNDALDQVNELASPLTHPGDLDPLLERIGDDRVVLIGEASHGTSDYYRWRAELTKRLITERDFSFVAVEGDWPDCFAVNRWVKGRTGLERTATEVLTTFERWPTWMWANEETAEFLEWLRDYNRSTGTLAGFYGLDVYSLWESLERVCGYLGEHQPESLELAVQAFRCFEPYDEDPQRYAWATRMVPSSCESEVVELMREVHRTRRVFDGDPEAELDAVQNAEVLAGAESYYRAMVRADGESWNVRDCHMADTLDRLLEHHGRDAKAIVWEHNTHIGDARATDMAAAGMINVGQLVRERHGRDGVALVGLGGHRGSVIAGESWGAPGRRMPVPPAPRGTHEDLLHEAIESPSLFVFPEVRTGPWLGERRDHRAIGVVYHPDRDRFANWVPTVMGRRYDAFLYFDQTEALHPLHRELPAQPAERDTYPWST